MSYGEPAIRFGLVEDINDPTGSGRIKVRLSYNDRGYGVGDLAYAFPLNPKTWHIKPKVGEGVFVISQYLNKDKSQRYYIGPIIAQPQFMFFDSYLTSTRTLNGSRIGPDKNILFSKPEQTKGVLPKDDTVALLGRRDSDVFLEDNELYIRCGVKKTSVDDATDFGFNSQHPSFIKLQHEPDKQKAQSQGYESVASIVADRINLISTDSREYFKISNDDHELLAETELNKFLKDAHELPYGDVLVKFLKLFKTAFLKHEHRWAQLPPTDGTDGMKPFKEFDIDKILSQSIKIN